MVGNEIAINEPIETLVSNYEQGIKEIAAAYELLKRGYGHVGCLVLYPDVFPPSHSGRDPENMINRILRKLKRGAWEGVLEKARVSAFTTNKRYRKILKALDDPKTLPEISVRSITDFLDNLHSSAPELLIEFVKETFDYLKPGAYGLQDYKTNQKSKYELKEKIILSWVFDHWRPGSFMFQHQADSNFYTMDNCFHLLDGKGLSKFPGDAVTQIKTAFRDKQNQCETEYFQFKWFKNGNCHIRFKRMDIVDKLNQIAGDHLLKRDECVSGDTHQSTGD